MDRGLGTEDSTSHLDGAVGAIEFLADEVTLERRERIGNAKDASAAAVLVASVVSLVVWGLILWKRF